MVTLTPIQDTDEFSVEGTPGSRLEPATMKNNTDFTLIENSWQRELEDDEPPYSMMGEASLIRHVIETMGGIQYEYPVGTIVKIVDSPDGKLLYLPQQSRRKIGGKKTKRSRNGRNSKKNRRKTLQNRRKNHKY